MTRNLTQTEIGTGKNQDTRIRFGNIEESVMKQGETRMVQLGVHSLMDTVGKMDTKADGH